MRHMSVCTAARAAGRPGSRRDGSRL